MVSIKPAKNAAKELTSITGSNLYEVTPLPGTSLTQHDCRVCFHDYIHFKPPPPGIKEVFLHDHRKYEVEKILDMRLLEQGPQLFTK